MYMRRPFKRPGYKIIYVGTTGEPVISEYRKLEHARYVFDIEREFTLNDRERGDEPITISVVRPNGVPIIIWHWTPNGVRVDGGWDDEHEGYFL